MLRAGALSSLLTGEIFVTVLWRMSLGVALGLICSDLIETKSLSKDSFESFFDALSLSKLSSEDEDENEMFCFLMTGPLR